MNKGKILAILETAVDKNGDIPMRLVRHAFEKLPELCEDAVSRKAVIDLYKRGAEKIAKANSISVEDLPHNGLDVLMNLPSVTPKRKTGKWLPVKRESILNDGTMFMFHKCDQCERVIAKNYDFCPNCGADMRGEQK